MYFIIVIIYKNFNELKILSKIQINDNAKIENQTFLDINVKDDKNLNFVISELKRNYENYWKDINKINTSIKLPLNVSLESSNYEKILNFEGALEDLDLIFSYEISKFDNKIINYKLIYNGAPNQFINDLETKGFEIDIQNQNWKIK